MLTPGSYIVYVAIIAGYLVLILFFFPETRYNPSFDLMLLAISDFLS